MRGQGFDPEGKFLIQMQKNKFDGIFTEKIKKLRDNFLIKEKGIKFYWDPLD